MLRKGNSHRHDDVEDRREGTHENSIFIRALESGCRRQSYHITVPCRYLVHWVIHIYLHIYICINAISEMNQ